VTSTAVVVTTASVAALQDRMFDSTVTAYESSLSRIVTNKVSVSRVAASLDTEADLDAQPDTATTAMTGACLDVANGLGAVEYARSLPVPQHPSLTWADPATFLFGSDRRSLADFENRLRGTETALSTLGDFCSSFPAISQVASSAQAADAQLLAPMRVTAEGAQQQVPGGGTAVCRTTAGCVSLTDANSRHLYGVRYNAVHGFAARTEFNFYAASCFSSDFTQFCNLMADIESQRAHLAMAVAQAYEDEVPSPSGASPYPLTAAAEAAEVQGFAATQDRLGTALGLNPGEAKEYGPGLDTTYVSIVLGRAERKAESMIILARRTEEAAAPGRRP